MVYTSSQISKFLDSECYGNVVRIDKVSSMNKIRENSLIFLQKFSNEYLNIINDSNKELLVLCKSEYQGLLMKPHIFVENPRLSFARTVNHFLKDNRFKNISPKSLISGDAKIGEDLEVLSNSVIEEGVQIGNNVSIGYNVVLRKGTIIGDNSIIKSNTVIGEEGFGFEYDENNVPIRIPHMGGVIIGKNVEVGALNSICKGTIDNTIIGDNVKLSDQVHVAHNVSIEKSSMVAAGTRINGSSKIGKDVWIGPNSIITNNIVVENSAVIGIGSVVISNVSTNMVVVGNPAKYLRDN